MIVKFDIVIISSGSVPEQQMVKYTLPAHKSTTISPLLSTINSVLSDIPDGKPLNCLLFGFRRITFYTSCEIPDRIQGMPPKSRAERKPGRCDDCLQEEKRRIRQCSTA